MKWLLILFFVIFVPLFVFAGYVGIQATKGLKRVKRKPGDIGHYDPGQINNGPPDIPGPDRF